MSLKEYVHEVLPAPEKQEERVIGGTLIKENSSVQSLPCNSSIDPEEFYAVGDTTSYSDIVDEGEPKVLESDTVPSLNVAGHETLKSPVSIGPPQSIGAPASGVTRVTLTNQSSRVSPYSTSRRGRRNPLQRASINNSWRVSLMNEFLDNDVNVEPSRAFQARGMNAFNAKREEIERRANRARKIETQGRYSYTELLVFKVSAIPEIIWPALIHGLWATLWTVMYEVVNLKVISVPPVIITLLGVAVTLILVFRTNTAYDRYWEGRRAWGELVAHTRNFSRILWISVNTSTREQIEQKIGCENLLIAYSVALKHALRNELGHNYEDLYFLLSHIPEFSSRFSTEYSRNLPLHISLHIVNYLKSVKIAGQLKEIEFTEMLAYISHMTNCITVLERIRNTPIPFAYSVHISQTVNLYLLTLPFQIVARLSWWTIAVVLLSAFVLLGLESIGSEIENPFRYDKDGLPLDTYCDDLRDDVYHLIRDQSNQEESKNEDIKHKEAVSNPGDIMNHN